MSGTDWIVIGAGTAAIAWVNWYFFLAQRPSLAATISPRGSQEAEIVVRGGYSPAVVRLKRGVPARLVFDRQDTSSCSEEVVLPDFGIRRFLPTGEKTAVEFTPEQTGDFDITCGMSMLHGSIHVE
ncbi:MAG TPA: cupredoxin domain-containing protein [Gemmatimonadaceae bacterium]|nr:cupredoxin domain-containing protein [Gemmatimonadaceae bacterium]